MSSGRWVISLPAARTVPELPSKLPQMRNRLTASRTCLSCLDLLEALSELIKTTILIVLCRRK